MTTKTTTYRTTATSSLPVQRDILSESTVPFGSVDVRTVTARTLEPRLLPRLDDAWSPPRDGAARAPHASGRKT